ncbi:MAG: diguanylate cyclase [Rhodoferax sp.]|nr:diguanylate cyclase [Rhodoferax sp.]
MSRRSDLVDLEQKIGAAAQAKNGVSEIDQRIAEIQILRHTAALKEIALLDQHGVEVLRVSRRATDVTRNGQDFSSADWFGQVKSGRPYRSPVYFQDGALFMTIAMAAGPEAAGITVAEVDLEFLLDGITRIKVGESGHAYAVDAQGDLIAHPDIGLVLRHTSMVRLPQVKAAIHDPSGAEIEMIDAHDLDGQLVLTAFGVIPYLNWFVFVEEPLAQAYRPLYAQAGRSALLMLAGMVLTVLACVALVRQMVQPIHALRDGAKLIGRGVFDCPIVVRTGDELEELASEFNRMAQQLHESYTLLEHKVAQRTAELTQSEQLLRETQSIAGLGSFALDVAAGVWQSSDVFDGLFGIDKTYERTVPGWLALVHPDEQATMLDYLKLEMLGKGLAFDKVYRIIRHDNQAERWVHGLGRLEFDAQRQPIKMLGTIQDITEHKLMEDQVRQLAFYDPLTELPNRRLLNDRLRQSLIASKRSGLFGALMFLDLDKFKPVNDSHGHGVGDLLLIEVAARLKASMRKADTVARLGGDEFVVMLYDLSLNQVESAAEALAVAEKIGKSLAQPYRLTLRPEGQAETMVVLECSASIGVYIFGSHSRNTDEVLKGADQAMYQAKAAGGNGIRLGEKVDASP